MHNHALAAERKKPHPLKSDAMLTLDTIAYYEYNV